MTQTLPPSRRAFVAMLAIPFAVPSAFAQSKAGQPALPKLHLDGAEFIHRWSKDTQHEFTPAAEPDLTRWITMVTLNRHRAATNGDGLAQVANGVLGNYRQHGKILRTTSKPASVNQPAEHFIAVAFGRPTFLEVAFTRIFLLKGTGFTLTYSYRIYDAKAGPAMSQWLMANGKRVETALFAWNEPPVIAAVSR
jgi:hypothetical protein